MPSSGWFPDPIQLMEFPIISFNFGSQYHAPFLLMLSFNFLLTPSSARSHSWGTANSISCPQYAFKIALGFCLTPASYSHFFTVVLSSWKRLLGLNMQMCSRVLLSWRKTFVSGLWLKQALSWMEWLRKKKYCGALQNGTIWMRYEWLI